MKDALLAALFTIVSLLAFWGLMVLADYFFTAFCVLMGTVAVLCIFGIFYTAIQEHNKNV